MTTITIGASRSYTENVACTARDLFVALFALNASKAATKKTNPPINPSMFDAYADVFNLQPKSLAAQSQANRSKRGSALVPYAHWSASWYYDKE
jgi:hypothetical protein